MTGSGSCDVTPLLVDARGLNCPLPLLKLKRAVATHPGVAVLELLATDADSVVDVEKFARQAGYRLAVARDTGGVITCRLARD